MSGPPTVPLRLIKLPSFVHFVLYVLLPVFLFVLCFFIKQHRLLSLVFLLALGIFSAVFFNCYLFIFSICNIMLTCIRPPPVLFTNVLNKTCLLFFLLTQHKSVFALWFLLGKVARLGMGWEVCACPVWVSLSLRLSLSFGCIFLPCTLISFFNYC